MTRNRLITGMLTLIFGLSLSGRALIATEKSEHSPGKIHETEVLASDEPLIARSDYKIWIPENASIIRSIFAINIRAAGKHLFYRDPEWRALAARTGSAMIYCEFEAKVVQDNGYGLSMLKACEQFATKLNRPELEHAPLVLWGHSMGGRVAQDFVRFRPERVLAFHIALRANPSPEATMSENAAAMKVPALYLMGEEDGKPKDIQLHFNHSRKKGSPRAWIWLPGQAHWPKGMFHDKDETTVEDWRSWAANDVVIPWTEAIIQLRLPESQTSETKHVQLRGLQLEEGWLGDVETGRIAPYKEFKGEKSTASWFPTENIARAWVGFSRPRQSEE